VTAATAMIGQRLLAPPPFLMAPFLDLVFASIGVFLLIFSLQTLLPDRPLPRPPVARAVLCTDNQSLRFYAAPTADPITYSAYDLDTVFAVVTDPGPTNDVARGGGTGPMLIAVGPGCAALASRVRRAYRAFLDRSPGGAAPETPRPRAPRLAFWPLSADASAETAFLELWRQGLSGPTQDAIAEGPP